MNDNLLNLLRSGADLLDISLTEKAESNLLKYIEILSYWNTKVNLVSYKNASDLITLHILDSITLFKIIPMATGLRIMDIGSGAGFPGLVLKIVSEPLEITLVEKNPKRVVFLKEVVRKLGLEGIIVLNSDYNSLRNTEHFQNYHLVVSRAFSSKPDFFRNLTFFLKNNCSFVVMAGPSFEPDLLIDEGFSAIDYWEGQLPHTDKSRRLIKYSRTESSAGKTDFSL